MYWNGPYHDMGMGTGWGWWMPFHGLTTLLLIALVVIGTIVLIRSLTARDVAARRPPHSPGLGVLEERYAKGEIQREEYLQKKRDILGS